MPYLHIRSLERPDLHAVADSFAAATGIARKHVVATWQALDATDDQAIVEVVTPDLHLRSGTARLLEAATDAVGAKSFVRLVVVRSGEAADAGEVVTW